MKTVLIFLIVANLLLAGCNQQQAQNDSMQKPGDAMEEKNKAGEGTENKSGDAMENKTGDAMEEPGDSMGTTYGGQIIAGMATPYIRYNEADFNKARDEGKVIYLYFYANWCPICAAERPTIFEAFNEMDDPEVVGFEVHYKDSQTNEEDTAAARTFGVPYQHTTIILRPDGSESYRSLNPISKETIKAEIEEAKG